MAGSGGPETFHQSLERLAIRRRQAVPRKGLAIQLDRLLNLLVPHVQLAQQVVRIHIVRAASD
jgi:hypothetical protein